MLPTEQLSEECKRAVEKFTSAHERNRHEERALKLNRWLWVALCLWSSHMVYLCLSQRWVLASTQLLGIAPACLAWWFLNRKDNLLASVWALVWGISMSVAISSELGGRMESIGIWFLATSILVAVPFVDSRTLKKMALVPGGFIVALLGLELLGVPSSPNWYPEEYFMFSRIQMVILYGYLSYHSTKQGERELMVLGDHRESSIEAAQRAEREDRKKTKFLAKMSHELRTPMNGLLGMVQYLETRGLSSESQSLLLRLRKRSEHILEHINDALDLTLADAGNDSSHDAKKRANFDLNKLISGVCDVQTQFGSLSHCRLDVSLSIDSGVFVGDNRRLRHLLSTLLGTAFQDCPSGAVQLHVWQDPVAANDTRVEKELPVHFEVTYDIEEKEPEWVLQNGVHRTASLPHLEATGVTRSTTVQERSVQLDWGSKYASVFRVAQLLGGTFEITRESETRMRAIACIPLLQSMIAIPRRPSLESFANQAPVTVARRALVVDDNAINLKVAVLLLKKLGCESETANDGVEAVQMALSKPFDVIFMDLRMPNMDGFEATREILAQRKEHGSHCPIIALTANAFEADIKQAADAGMVEHLAKPVTLAALSDALERHVPQPQLAMVPRETRSVG